ncbi:MAG: hypothetical protein A3K46_00590 [Chloroflexi bacterium RBG_13_60_9]|nr:MAG: hypothetical protein A3K46_00590 [Chloroflexi bacterium RBG_13_60_9]
MDILLGLARSFPNDSKNWPGFADIISSFPMRGIDCTSCRDGGDTDDRHAGARETSICFFRGSLYFEFLMDSRYEDPRFAFIPAHEPNPSRAAPQGQARE